MVFMLSSSKGSFGLLFQTKHNRLSEMIFLQSLLLSDLVNLTNHLCKHLSCVTIERKAIPHSQWELSFFSIPSFLFIAEDRIMLLRIKCVIYVIVRILSHMSTLLVKLCWKISVHPHPLEDCILWHLRRKMLLNDGFFVS